MSSLVDWSRREDGVFRFDFFFLVCSPSTLLSSLSFSLILRLSRGVPQDRSRGYARRDGDGLHGHRRGLCRGPPKQQQHRCRRRIAGQEERRRRCCVGNVDGDIGLGLSRLARLRRDGRCFLRCAPAPGVARRGSSVLVEAVSLLSCRLYSFSAVSDQHRSLFSSGAARTFPFIFPSGKNLTPSLPPSHALLSHPDNQNTGPLSSPPPAAPSQPALNPEPEEASASRRTSLRKRRGRPSSRRRTSPRPLLIKLWKRNIC